MGKSEINKTTNIRSAIRAQYEGREWVTISEVAELFLVSESTIRRYVASELLSKRHLRKEGRNVLVVHVAEVANLFSLREEVKQKRQGRRRLAELGLAILSGTAGGIAGKFAEEIFPLLLDAATKIFRLGSPVLTDPQIDLLIENICSKYPELVQQDEQLEKRAL